MWGTEIGERDRARGVERTQQIPLSVVGSVQFAAIVWNSDGGAPPNRRSKLK
jgi:hypothetical protein